MIAIAGIFHHIWLDLIFLLEKSTSFISITPSFSPRFLILYLTFLLIQGTHWLIEVLSSPFNSQNRHQSGVSFITLAVIVWKLAQTWVDALVGMIHKTLSSFVFIHVFLVSVHRINLHANNQISDRHTQRQRHHTLLFSLTKS